MQHLACMFKIAHSCYGQLIDVKTRYPLTSINMAMPKGSGLELNFQKFTADPEMAFHWIAESRIFTNYLEQAKNVELLFQASLNLNINVLIAPKPDETYIFSKSGLT